MSEVRGVARRVAEGLAFVLVLPLIGWFRVRRALFPGSRDRGMRGMSQSLALLPGVIGSYLRCAFYRGTMLSVGRPCFIGFGTIFATADVRLGDRVYIGAFCNLGHVDIDDDVMLGSNVTILSGKHQHGFARTDVPMNRQEGRFDRVRIGSDCWLGNGSIVLADVSPGTIVAAGATVTKTLPRLSILGGNPATVIAERNRPAPG